MKFAILVPAYFRLPGEPPPFRVTFLPTAFLEAPDVETALARAKRAGHFAPVVEPVALPH